ncbi:MAG: ZIP family metal transporter [Actinomycetota bacterium]|nr:ZIP family metal transporter [Actinomycetota bacterium]MDQ2981449.1 ZIP family metal transporter [Actinomycetota bacterium]
MGAGVIGVTLAALATALATGLGALPFVFMKSMSRRSLGMSNAVAAGFMLSASGALLLEGATRGLGRVLAGFGVGVIFIAATRRLLERRDHPLPGRLPAADAMKSVLIVVVMTLHSFSEGVGVGVSYGGGTKLGIFITIAIAIHNIPEGLAISLVLIPRGSRVLAAAGWSIFTSLPQPLVAAPAYLFVESFRSILAAGLGFAAGAMIWLVFAELLPDARAELESRRLALGLGGSFAVMSLLQLALLTR